MLSAIGRAAIRRVGVGASQSTNRTLQSIWHLQLGDAPQNTDNASTRPRLFFSLQRSYATTTKAAPKTRATSTTKPKTKAAPKKPVKKPAKKKKAVAKKSKPKVKKPVKKILTDEQKLKAQVKELKAKALLSSPKLKPSTAWSVLLSEHMATQGSGGRSNVGATSKEASAKYKSLSPQELEAYNHTANQNKASNEVAYKQWIESHTPDEIYTANNARKLLKKKVPGSVYPSLQDARIPKRPVQAHLFFGADKQASGDFKGLKPTEAVSLSAKEWVTLSPSERKPYEDRASADRERYIQEYKTVFHRDPELIRRPAKAS